MSDGRILPPWVPVQASNPPDVLATLDAEIKTIDRFTDSIIKRTRSPKTLREIAAVWSSAMHMYYLAVKEIELLHKEATSDD